MKYSVIEVDDAKRQVKIRGDNNRIRWFPLYCFDLSGKDAPTIRNIMITDSIDDPLTSSIDVEIELSDGQWRWCFFVTPELLAQSGNVLEGTEVRLHYGAPHMVVVSQISEDIIKQSLKEIERQGELIDCTKVMEWLVNKTDV